jgi:hypothetical protein
MSKLKLKAGLRHKMRKYKGSDFVMEIGNSELTRVAVCLYYLIRVDLGQVKTSTIKKRKDYEKPVDSCYNSASIFSVGCGR